MHRNSFNHTSIQSRMKALNCKFVIKANNDMIQKVTLCKKRIIIIGSMLRKQNWLGNLNIKK